MKEHSRPFYGPRTEHPSKKNKPERSIMANKNTSIASKLY